MVAGPVSFAKVSFHLSVVPLSVALNRAVRSSIPDDLLWHLLPGRQGARPDRWALRVALPADRIQQAIDESLG
ncbi:MAG: hypothetical protein ACJ757_05935 [Gaiellaceae bacterium]